MLGSPRMVAKKVKMKKKEVQCDTRGGKLHQCLRTLFLDKYRF